MADVLKGGESLRELFAALTEHTFQVEFGVADPPLLEYLTDLLVRFVRVDVIFRLRDLSGRRLDEVADMLWEAEQREARPQREAYRHIGDFTLFWVGVYPEAVSRLKSPDRKDSMLDYFEQGKRSYYLASQFDDEPYRAEAPVLRRLSQEFEICSFGLNRVRTEWERLPGAAGSASSDAERN